MQNFALKAIVAIAIATGSIAFANGAFAQDDTFDLSVPKPEAEAEGQENLECGTETISGSGPGFHADRDKSETMAIDDWTEKAKKVFPDPDFDLAKDSNLSCAVQGLYSKCFADGIPCREKAE
ncbi:hypothetical protein [Methyloceanibacter sp.]|uniref:hypothetical protein n=1 Tax=Methyloceanibacter sp. TaxID=1965321 RepID=UPI002CADCDCB|nr:hypothetical protein [Methyloceanibacter sp.]HML91716.1 hypothetical protein [Methyloceanibacter sp.]